MNEDDWLTKDYPRPMYDFARPRATTRQLRYFGAACCRLVWDYLRDDRLCAAVECVEQYAAGVATKQVLASAQNRARELVREAGYRQRAGELLQVAVQNTTPGCAPDWGPYYELYRHGAAAEAVALLARPTERLSALGESVSQVFDHLFRAMLIGRVLKVRHPQLLTLYAAIIRDVFGNPFQPAVEFEQSWRTEAAVAIARGLYESRDFIAAPVLADALEDAGCNDAAVLGHLRGGGPHVRGCWCVDGVLGFG